MCENRETLSPEAKAAYWALVADAKRGAELSSARDAVVAAAKAIQKRGRRELLGLVAKLDETLVILRKLEEE